MDPTPHTEQPRWRIGELARHTGLSVRALRHYDEIGLLAASERSHSGYRLYGEGDLRRLYRIVALRHLGMGLEEIARVLDGTAPDLRQIVRHQLEELERQRELQDRLGFRLRAILEALDRADEPSTELFIAAIEVTIMIEKYYTPQQRERLAERERELGAETVGQTQRDWAELIAAVKTERERGTDPTGPTMQTLAGRWRELLRRFTGGDESIRRSL